MLTIMKVPRGTVNEELDMVCNELDTLPSPVYVPRLFIKLGLETIRRMEKCRHIDCGPRVGIDAALGASDRAASENHPTAQWQDMLAALPAAAPLSGAGTGKELDSAEIPDIADFLQQELAGIDLAELIRAFHSTCGAQAAMSAENVKKIIAARASSPELERFAAWVMQHEKIYNFKIYEVIAAYLQAYRQGIAEQITARRRTFSSNGRAHCNVKK